MSRVGKAGGGADGRVCGGAAVEPEQAWLYSEHGDDCAPGDPGCGSSHRD